MRWDYFPEKFSATDDIKVGQKFRKENISIFIQYMLLLRGKHMILTIFNTVRSVYNVILFECNNYNFFSNDPLRYSHLKIY
ncbi:hypothetical protein CBF17_020550 [Pantoea agglomerans]|nr:hypothetical protein CBF17_020550 [Pantoea agglomerans]